MSEHIFIAKARVSYPHLFKQPVINGELGKCGACLLLEPSHPAVAKIQAEIARLQRERFDGMELPTSKLCMRSGKERMKPEYGTALGVSANVKDGRRPLVLDGDGQTRIELETGCKIYAGCYVNAKIALWVQDNTHGKRINAELIAIQYAGEGEPLDDSHVSEDEAKEGFGESKALVDEPLDF